ncbi:MAG: LptF/LptG family permease [Campylobacterales bacterium]|nr:LptF/LptG family permease [Campylobacterales bacterium]
MTFGVKRYFIYLAYHFFKNFLIILGGISLAFAVIDYFQHARELEDSFNINILYIFYMWQEALALLYPLALVFALIMTKLTLVKNSNMAVLYAFGFSTSRLFTPFLTVATAVYILFLGLHTTSFSYAKENAESLLHNEIGAYLQDDLFFKYNDTFVYIKNLDPVNKVINDMTIFKVTNNQIDYVMHSKRSVFNGESWDAYDVDLKTHHHKEGNLINYDESKIVSIKALEGYKPKVIESLYDGKALTIHDSFDTWMVLFKEGINSDKIRASFYEKVVMPLFALFLMAILFSWIPFYGRFADFSKTTATSLGVTFLVWGVIFGLHQLGTNSVISPELTSLLPIVLLAFYTSYRYKKEYAPS